MCDLYTKNYDRGVKNPKNLVDVICNETGLEVMERLHFLASLPLAGTAQTEGGAGRVTSLHGP